MSEVNFWSAVAMARQVREKKVSPVELVEAHLAQIEKLNPRLNAFVELHVDGAREQARRAESAMMSGASLGPLHGVPLSIKSSIAVKGMRCEAGSKLRAGAMADADAVLVSRLRDAGAVILGTTNTPEMLMAWETDNPLYGRTNNPWDLSRTAGGSSGGEAAAIASGCSAGGVGSDGGGSIRVPAHFTGICGLKPTPGRIPATGHFPISVGPFASIGVVGPMARTVDDLRVLFEAMQGSDDGDPSAAPVPVRWPDKKDLKNLRIGYFEDDGRTPVTAETREAVRKAAQGLKDAGFMVEPFRPDGLEQARQLWWQIFGTVGGMLLRPMIQAGKSEVGPLLKQFLAWVATEPSHSGESLLNTWIQRDVIRIKIFEQMQKHPVLLCPAAAVPAFHHGEREWQVDGKMVKYLDAWSYTEWFNLLGMPAAVVPVAESKDGLPIGVQISARPWQEETVLGVAAELEQRLGCWRKPPIA